jgi:hypothetical protein
MKPMDLVSLRKKAENAVADMTDGPLKIKAFEVILGSLLATPSPHQASQSVARPVQTAPTEAPSSIAARISLLADEAFFSQPRSLGEIQDSLAQHGWHYPQSNLSTPLIRLVRQRRLRRLQLAEGNKKVWKYSLP